MGYSNFKKISQVTKKFGLDARFTELFSFVTPVEPSEWLKTSLKMASKMPLTNEKPKSERLVSPVLMEIAVAYENQVSLFSGEDIFINSDDDLSGPCDFFFGLHPPKPYIDTPIISLTEAKDEDIEWGVAQCAAQMYAAYLLNLQENKNIPMLYGCATDGEEWRFLKFENNIFYIEPRPITDLTKVLGTWHWIIQFFIENYSEKQS